MANGPGAVVHEVPFPEVALGRRRFDIRHRALVVGLLPAPPDRAGGGGGAFLSAAEGLVADGADALEVDGTAAGPGASPTALADRVGSAVDRLVRAFDLPVAVTTGRADVLGTALAAGAVVGRDPSGFSDPAYLPAAAGAGASVIAAFDPAGTSRAERARPESSGGARTSAGAAEGEAAVEVVAARLRGEAEAAEAAGLPRFRVMLDADLAGAGRPSGHELLRAHDRLAALGWPLVLSLPGEAPSDPGGGAPTAAHALGIALGCRVLRTSHVRDARRTADVMAAVLAARLGCTVS